MREYLAKKCLAVEAGIMLAAGKMKECAKRLVQDENGDTNFVAIIIIIVIILAIAAVFREQLLAAVNAVFGQLMDFIGGE